MYSQGSAETGPPRRGLAKSSEPEWPQESRVTSAEL